MPSPQAQAQVSPQLWSAMDIVKWSKNKRPVHYQVSVLLHHGRPASLLLPVACATCRRRRLHALVQLVVAHCCPMAEGCRWPPQVRSMVVLMA